MVLLSKIKFSDIMSGIRQVSWYKVMNTRKTLTSQDMPFILLPRFSAIRTLTEL
jgi:hypothetical protein